MSLLRRHRRGRVGLCAAALLCLAAPSFAQTAAAPPEPQTRAEQLQQQRESKQTELKPYERNALERTMELAEEKVFPFLMRDGLYGKVGSISTSSGFALGAGYRDRSLIRGLGAIDLFGGWSLKHYWTLSSSVDFPVARRERVLLNGYARRYSFVEEEFTGIGPDSMREQRVVYSMKGWVAGGGLKFKPVKPLIFGAGVEYQDPEVGPGQGARFPSLETFFDDSTAPAFGGAPEFTKPWAFAEVDYREPLNARRGGYYRVDVSRVEDRRGGATSFTRADVDLRQFFSFLAERRIIAVRALASTTETADGARVPFYLLPTLGGNDTLRGFRALRFHGAHRMLMQAEYRFEVWSGFDAALFYDTGKVADRRTDLNFKNLEKDYGIGFRFATDTGVVLRVDAAFGSRDGKHLHIVFGGVF